MLGHLVSLKITFRNSFIFFKFKQHNVYIKYEVFQLLAIEFTR